MRLKFSLILAIFSTNIALKLIVKFTKTIILSIPKKATAFTVAFLPHPDAINALFSPTHPFLWRKSLTAARYDLIKITAS